MNNEAPPATFYVKGSYVLDYVFGRETRHDIDVFYQRYGQPPTKESVRAWLNEMRLPDEELVDLTPVDDVDSCSGGDQPFFGFERWHIKQDGRLYTLVDTDEPSGELALWGQPAVKTRAVALSREDAQRQPLQLLRDVTEISHDDAGLIYIAKLLDKSNHHPELGLVDVAKQLEEQKERIEANRAHDGDEREDA